VYGAIVVHNHISGEISYVVCLELAHLTQITFLNLNLVGCV